jgi:hypothetical protein
MNDVANAVAVYTALAPVVRTTSVNGSGIDMIAADGPCFAVQQIGAISEDVAWVGHIEESDNNSTWTAIDDAEFASVDAPSNIQTITFQRRKRYLRYVGTPTGTDPSVPVSAFIGQLHKTF